MKLRKILFLYRGWLRANAARELLTALGVVVGVALVFATLTMNGSIFSASNQIVKTLSGRAQLQASARSPDGVPEALALKPYAGVAVNAGALEVPVTFRHAGHSVTTQLVGLSPQILRLNRVVANAPLVGAGLALPSTLAARLGVHNHEAMTVVARGKVTTTRVQTVLGAETVGPLAQSLDGFAFLRYVQALVGMPHRISTILVRAKPGQQALAAEQLRGLEPAMRISPTTDQGSLLHKALQPQSETTAFFVLLGVVVGLLLVATATMLSATDRRSELASLQLQGYSKRQLVAIVLFQGFVLGFVGALLGVVVGAIAAMLYAESPDYLASAFPLGKGSVLSLPLAVAVLVGGALGTTACVGWVLLDLRGSGEAHAPRGLAPRTRYVALLAAALLTAVSALVNSQLLTAILLAVIVLLVVPSALALFTAAAARIGAASRHFTGAGLAAGGIRAAELRAYALAVTAAIGAFGAVVAVDAHNDLLQGLERGYRSYVGSAKVWVTAPGDNLATSPLDTRLASAARSVPGVRSVRPYYGGWLDVGGRRVWVIARSVPLPSGQLARGRFEGQLARSEMGMSDQLARALDVRVGGQTTIPTPIGRQRLTLVATTSNLGWSSGVLFLPMSDYTPWFGSAPTAFEVEAPASAVPAMRRALGAGVEVRTASDRARIADALPRQGLRKVAAIAWLLVIAASVAVALALGSTIWQRRAELASLRLQSFRPWALQRMLGWESLIVVGAGVVVGLLAGSWGHYAADGYLRTNTGYPVAQSADLFGVFGVGAIVVVTTSLILALPGYIAARAPMRLALDGR